MGSFSKPEIIKNIAATLVERRKMRGVSLETVSQRLKIRVVFLEGIEKGDWDILPGPVYIKGFVTRYAQYLGLDGNTLLAPYFSHLRQAARESQEEEPEHGDEEQSKRFWMWGGLIIIGFIAFLRMLAPSKNAVDVTPPKSPVGESHERPFYGEETPPSVKKTEEHVLSLYCPFPLWIRAIADNRRFEGFIPESSSWTWQASGTIHLKLGHTRQVALSFDGVQLDLHENQKILSLPHEN